MESLENAIEGLKYIADSPLQEHGGFHPNTVKIAKTALFHLEAERTRRMGLETFIESMRMLTLANHLTCNCEFCNLLRDWQKSVQVAAEDKMERWRENWREAQLLCNEWKYRCKAAEEEIKRIRGNWICPHCGMINNPPTFYYTLIYTVKKTEAQ